MLTNKYLKYSPEITLEIFTLICNKLIESGIKIRKYPLEWHWDRFQEKYPNLLIPDGENEFSVWGDTQNKRKTTVQEILGYDPFVNKEVIPEYVEIESGREGANYNHWLGIRDKVNSHYNRKYKVLKVVDSNSEYSYALCYLLVDPDGNYANFQAEACNISSREVYELQNKPKPPLKQAVHCKTQEEWDFITEKIGYKFTTKFKLGVSDTINPSSRGCESKSFFERRGEYNLLSFQEWCDLNGYKMENKQEFIVGSWYKSSASENNRTGRDYYGKFLSYDNNTFTASWHSVDNDFSEGPYSFCSGYKWELMTDLSEIQQYLPNNHPDKIKTNQKFKVGQLVWISSMPIRGNGMKLDGSDDGVYKLMDLDSPEFATGHLLENSHFKFKCGKDYFRTNIKNIRHATPEEINNHLISTGEIGEVISIDTNAGIFSPRIGSYDVYGPSDCIADNSIGIHQGYFNPNIEASRKINWMAGVKETQNEVQLELIDIPKI